MPRQRTFYATQFGYYWALSEDQLRQILTLGVEQREYNLDAPGAARAIKHKPKPHSIVFEFLDWEPDAFATTLAELDAGEESFLWQAWIWRA